MNHPVISIEESSSSGEESAHEQEKGVSVKKVYLVARLLQVVEDIEKKQMQIFYQNNTNVVHFLNRQNLWTLLNLICTAATQ